MEELSLIILLLNRDNFVKYYRYVKGIENIQTDTKNILYTIDEFYKQYENIDCISVDELAVYYNTVHPLGKMTSYLKEVFNTLKTVDISDEVSKDIVKRFIKMHVAAQLVEAGATMSEGVSLDAFSDLKNKLEEVEEQIDEIDGADGFDPNFVRMSFEDLVSTFAKDEGLYWRCDCLNRNLGPVVRGTLGMFYAIPNAGKTSFAVSELTGFAKQLKSTSENVLYLGNEQHHKFIEQRIFTALLNEPYHVLVTNMEYTQQRAVEEGYRRIKHYFDVFNIDQVEKYIRRHSPVATFVDMGLKVTMRYMADGHSGLQALCSKYRQLAKKYNTAVILCAQADNDAMSKQWLAQNNIHGSNIDVAGEMDYMIGCTWFDRPNEGHLRYLTLSKEKVGATEHRLFAQLETTTGRFGDA